MLQKFKECCLNNLILFIMASTMFYFNHKYTIESDPILIVGMFIVYLELSKLLYITATGASAPIMIRYLMASLVVGMSVKFYESAIIYDIWKMITYSIFILIFLSFRYLAIISTKQDKTRNEI